MTHSQPLQVPVDMLQLQLTHSESALADIPATASFLVSKTTLMNLFKRLDALADMGGECKELYKRCIGSLTSVILKISL